MKRDVASMLPYGIMLLLLSCMQMLYAESFFASPQLVEEPPMLLPVKELLLQEIEGDVVVDVDIDVHGTVERCSVVTAISPLVDTIVAAALRKARFTPAYEAGSVVPATITMTYAINRRKLLESGIAASPELYGTVVDGLQKYAVANARISLEYGDTAQRIKRCLYTIADVPGQRMRDGFLSTVSDSLGRFSFRLLPPGNITMVIAARGYEPVRYLIDVPATTARKVSCNLQPIVQQDSSIEIVVYGKPLFTTRVSVEELQVATGLTHYLSDVLLTKPAIHAVPESKSMMMVRAGNPYDNRYYICGVPFLAPFHFGGHGYADVDGLMISALGNVDVTIDRIAGRQVDASGFRIDAQPIIYRPASRKLIERNELTVDYNTAGQDFLLSVPVKKSDLCFQLGYTHGDSMTLSFLDARNDRSANEFGSPRNYRNLTFTGAGNVGSCSVQTFSWLAKSTYSSNGLFDPEIPWGMSAVTIEPATGVLKRVHCGGSHQYFATGRKAGLDFYRKLVTLSNGTVSLTSDTISLGGFGGIVDIGGDYTTWDGALEKTHSTIIDSIRTFEGRFDYRKNDTITSNFVTASGKELTCQVHAGINRKFGSFYTALDLLAAGVLYSAKPSVIGDAGAAAGWENSYVQIGINGGRITYRPDIRGMPDSSYRREQASTYLLSLPAFIKLHRTLTCNIQPYIRYKNHEPKLDPFLAIWQPEKATKLYAAGADANITWKPTDWFTFDNTFHRSRTERFADDTFMPYEWDIPWKIRTVLHVHFGNDPEIHFYLKGYASKGMRFDDVNRYRQIRAPDYRRIDFSMQYRSKAIKSRFLTRYDAYFNLFNITDRYNASDYYWDDRMVLQSIPQGYIFCEMGLRAGFRL